MNNEITLYTIHCPKCKMLQKLMEIKKVNFDVVDDMKTVTSVAMEYDIKSAPFAIINGELYDAKKLQQWIKEQ